MIGGWPEDYFMYAEDLDFFYQVNKKRIPVTYLDTQILHIGKGTTRHLWNERQRALIVENSFKKFLAKYHCHWQYYFVRPILLGFCLFRNPGDFIFQTSIFLSSIFRPIR
jgi:GT2 family glycosyltransferase